jgi:hypothetical protein
MTARFNPKVPLMLAAAAVIAPLVGLSWDTRSEVLPQAKFQEWTMALAKHDHLALCRSGQLTNPVSKEAGYFAWFTHKLGTKNGSDETYDENNSFAYIVFAAGDKKWVYGEVEEEALVLRCERQKGTFENVEKLQLDRSDTMGEHNWEYRTVTIDGTRGPVVLAEEDGHNQGGDDTKAVDWLTLVSKANIDPGVLDSRDEVGSSAEGAVFQVEKEGAPQLGGLPPAKTYVTFGKKSWSGDADASMQVRVTGAGAKIRVGLTIQDDKFVPVADGADAHALLRGDHVEVWFCQGGDTKACDDSRVRQFGFAVPADASTQVKPLWLYPANIQGVPPVRVSFKDKEIVAELDLPAMGIKRPSGRWRMPFTVVFSDSDDPKAGQQTLVATSKLHRRDPSSFGLIVGGVEQRFPPLERVADFDSKLGRKIRKGR